MAIKHAFTSAKGDGPDPTQVQPSHWNADHVDTTQVFRYTRQVGDTDTIVINGAKGFVARADANYNVQVTMGAFTSLLAAAAPPSLYTTTQFTLKLSAAPVAGDTFLFTVEDLT